MTMFTTGLDMQNVVNGSPGSHGGPKSILTSANSHNTSTLTTMCYRFL